jgi:hypothetical protein
MSEARTRSVDHAAAEAAKTFRATTDPIILHPANKGALDHHDQLKAWITEARLQAVEESPAGEPVDRATWPEVTAYLMSASLIDARFATGDAAEFYQYAFVETLDRFGGEVEPPAMIDQPALDDYRTAKLDRLRRDIKRDLDRQFVNERYDEIVSDEHESVPKAFWTDPLPAEDGEAQDTSTGQQTLGSFEAVSNE